MKKIGIITHFYLSTNYGGVLQAFALCRVINKIGYQCQQIKIPRKFDKLNGEIIENPSKIKGLVRKIAPKRLADSIIYRVYGKRAEIKKIKIMSSIHKKRLESFSNFIEANIPMSRCEYSSENVYLCQDMYDIFIAGSDQVWNYDWYNPAYFLNFVTNGAKKISYAASIGHDDLPERIKKVYKEHLESFTGISVREQKAVTLIQEISPVAVEQSLDPTLLLTAHEWEIIENKEMNIDEPYIFCYFLGTEKKHRDFVREFAQKYNLKIYSIPFVNRYNRMDKRFGDIQFENIGPETFLTLIHHANYVFTDSFHASVFSLIFQKEFLVFGRSDGKGMNDRIRNLLHIWNCEDRLCENPQCCSIDYLKSLRNIDYGYGLKNIEQLKATSINYLVKHLQ